MCLLTHLLNAIQKIQGSLDSNKAAFVDQCVNDFAPLYEKSVDFSLTLRQNPHLLSIGAQLPYFPPEVPFYLKTHAKEDAPKLGRSPLNYLVKGEHVLGLRIPYSCDSNLGSFNNLASHSPNSPFAPLVDYRPTMVEEDCARAIQQ